MKLRRDGDDNLTTTVGELIKKLQEFGENQCVYTEGCDCIGNVVDVTVESDGTVLLHRDDKAIEHTISEEGEVNFFISDRYKDRTDDLQPKRDE